MRNRCGKIVTQNFCASKEAFVNGILWQNQIPPACIKYLGAIGLALMALLPLNGCGTTKATSKQMARIAKDWSLVIRASQVIPVYPLTEDLQPGDVFLVRTRHEDQIKVYEAKGFLPLETLLTRLPITNYHTFYQNAYNVTEQSRPPHNWQFPTDTTKKSDWANAPRAAFPSYTFSIERGVGINLAVPVQGVPVAMSLLGAGQAHGSITIADAYTYGIDTHSLQKRMEIWAEEHRGYLDTLATQAAETYYLRVVSRVYLTGKVNIAVFSEEAAGASISAGAPKPVDLLKLASQDTSGKNYNAVLSAFNKSVEAAAPGGTIKVAAASGRSISLIETFPRPLVIGYIAFDLPILQGGLLGLPIPTESRLSKTPIIPAKETVYGVDQNSEKIKRWLAINRPLNRDRLREWLNQQGYREHGITNVMLGSDYVDLRAQIVSHFQIK